MAVVRLYAKMMDSTNCMDWSLGDSDVEDWMYPVFTSKLAVLSVGLIKLLVLITRRIHGKRLGDLTTTEIGGRLTTKVIYQ